MNGNKKSILLQVNELRRHSRISSEIKMTYIFLPLHCFNMYTAYFSKLSKQLSIILEEYDDVSWGMQPATVRRSHVEVTWCTGSWNGRGNCYNSVLVHSKVATAGDWRHTIRYASVVTDVTVCGHYCGRLITYIGTQRDDCGVRQLCKHRGIVVHIYDVDLVKQVVFVKHYV